MKRSWVMALVLLLGTSATLPAANPAAEKMPHNALTKAEIADGWILLFDGETLFGWEPGAKGEWKVADGAIHSAGGEQNILHTCLAPLEMSPSATIRNVP
ncbi:MAG TPA: family 16 glycoside hydrolase [Pirellulales bacterium]|jgi:hypothetical protein|nr:family 16 glycoside hydrolase [Pirellulales bacterium]